MMPKKVFESIDEYIAAQPKNIQAILQELRQAIKEAAPQAEEAISYQMPAFKQNGVLVWFAAFKNHVSFFPKVSAMRSSKSSCLLTKKARAQSNSP